MWRRSFRTAPHQGTGQLPLVQSRACNMTNFAFAQTAAWRGSRWWPGQRRACAKRSRSCAPCVAEHRPAAVAVSAVSPASKGPSLLAGAAPFGRAGAAARRRPPPPPRPRAPPRALYRERPAAGGGCGSRRTRCRSTGTAPGRSAGTRGARATTTDSSVMLLYMHEHKQNRSTRRPRGVVGPS